MATNMFKKYTEAKTREWAVAEGTQAGQVVINAQSGQVGVTLTARGDSSITVDGIATANGGVGNRAGGAVVAVDGSWLLDVDGVTAGDTGAGGAGTGEGTEVYGVVAAGEVTSLTLTATDNVFIGVIDDGVIVGTVAPVLIGAVL